MPSSTGSQTWPDSTEGDYETKNFTFLDGSTLPVLRLHYRTLGAPKLNESGQTTNAILIMHGTTGSSANFLSPQFAGELFNPGQLFDSKKYYIIIRDGIGHGGSSKPSDGLKANFPGYGYQDMVRADYELVTKGLGVNHLRLVMGTSMGGMHSWLWAGMYPDFMDAAMPLASLPTQISGRNRMLRKMVEDAVRGDPEWNNGNYKRSTDVRGFTTALYVLSIMSSVPFQWQKAAPDRESADNFLDKWITDHTAGVDCNDFLYAFEASRDYDPRPLLEKIEVPFLAINTADDQVNPPELGILEDGIKKVKRGRCVVYPHSENLRGHASHSWANIWLEEAKRLMHESEKH
ncbi:alpha/beta-hydrolase [Microthyrium microscopicum]|uniref:Alpha/beta-hydrolase n=1 Tax=Microthyrium microscopicum TaxID=703497 RepID=A0A6A6U0E3_9PEZI|nr:alpha/beta-hydrolase [Microthyrium microscopicum]